MSSAPHFGASNGLARGLKPVAIHSIRGRICPRGSGDLLREFDCIYHVTSPRFGRIGAVVTASLRFRPGRPGRFFWLLSRRSPWVPFAARIYTAFFSSLLPAFSHP